MAGAELVTTVDPHLIPGYELSNYIQSLYASYYKQMERYELIMLITADYNYTE